MENNKSNEGMPEVLAVRVFVPYFYRAGEKNQFGAACRIELERTHEHVVIQYGLQIEHYKIDEDGLEMFDGYL